MFTYRHIGYSIRLLRISLGRDRGAPSIRHLPTSKPLNKIQTVSRFIYFTTYHRTYCLLSILVDIQHILRSTDPVEISVVTIDRRLDDFLLQFQVYFNCKALKIASFS